ncbi:chemotaxis-specific protein-glutamate methyltransferase CheB [Ferrimicrobium sp.]|uniref:chemotaxis-specific protein-glutamate methyltransferase CheB n=1 Tax=Ferrimicrobium sp. TaxID=2926050 RepID=UPI00263430CD|nr:chemotaxis-specific protein-glutamate methyltransferase CheB [Ferrimicrobium sp.]
MVRILIADDSRVIRTRVAAWIAAEDDLELVGQAEDGLQALELFERLRPDVVVLDIEMPRLDGVATLGQIRATDPHVPIIMFSALTDSGSRMTVASMLAGASDYVPKPISFQVEDEIRQTLLARIRALVRPSPAGAERAPRVTVTPSPQRPGSPSPELIVVAASTGGPAALGAFLAALGRVDLPIVVVQHIAPHFLRLLVDQLGELLGTDVAIANDGEILRAGTIRFAPSRVHLELQRRDGRLVLAYSDAAPVNSCKPSADVLFGSAAVRSRRTIGVVLSGMGTDGVTGASAIVAHGGLVFAQDQASSAVWGMPGAVVSQGLARAVGSPSSIGARLRTLAAGRPTRVEAT